MLAFLLFAPVLSALVIFQCVVGRIPPGAGQVIGAAVGFVGVVLVDIALVTGATNGMLPIGAFEMIIGLGTVAYLRMAVLGAPAAHRVRSAVPSESRFLRRPSFRA